MSETVVLLAAESPDGEGLDIDLSTPESGEWLTAENVPAEMSEIRR